VEEQREEQPLAVGEAECGFLGRNSGERLGEGLAETEPFFELNDGQ